MPHDIDIASLLKLQTDGRITRGSIFVLLAELTAMRSTCLRGHVGSVIVVDGRPVSLGYNGAPPGLAHCLEDGCEPVAMDWAPILTTTEEKLQAFGCQRTVHAEANALAWAARNGISTYGAQMYSTHSPCIKCAQLMVAAGINELVYVKHYRAEAVDLLCAADVTVKKWHNGD